MTWRHVIAYWALALALAGWLYADSRAPAALPVDPTTPVAPLVAPPLERFDEVVLDRGADRFVFRRTDGRWTQSATDVFTVPSDLVAALLDTLSTIPPIERLASESGRQPRSSAWRRRRRESNCEAAARLRSRSISEGATRRGRRPMRPWPESRKSI